jgi:hypothetical protein
VKAAIANADAVRGVFRGHPITDYAPKPGDLIHHNRSGGTLTFEFAREHDGYPSHSAIVVDFEVSNGIRHAVTIGGNEFLAGGTGTVGRSSFPLDSNGFLNQAAIGPRLICVVENLLAARADRDAAADGARTLCRQCADRSAAARRPRHRVSQPQIAAQRDTAQCARVR